MSTNNRDKIIDFVYCHCPVSDIVGIMLTGSHADHTESDNSDIDIIVISMISSRQTHENIMERGTMYQLIIFPYSKLASIIYEDYATGSGVFFRMFTKEIILSDTNGVLQRLQKTLCNHSIPAKNEQDILKLRRRITNEIEYIIGNSETNKLYSVLEAIQMTAQLITGRYTTSGKHMDRLLNTHKEEQHLLQQALTTYLTNNDGKQFADTIQKTLQPFGGIVEKYTTGYLFNVPHEKHMLVCMPACTMKDEATRKVIQDILTHCEPSFYYYTSHPHSKTINEHCPLKHCAIT